MTKELVQKKIDELNKGCKYPLPITIIDWESEEPQPCLTNKIVAINVPLKWGAKAQNSYEVYHLGEYEDMDTKEFSDFISTLGYVDERENIEGIDTFPNEKD